MEDYYQILGVQQSANDKEIKTAYKRLALQWHPDKNPNNAEEASQKFKKIAEAYQILGNSQSRRDYNERLSFGSNFENGSSTSSRQNQRYNEDDFSSRGFSQTGGPSADFFSFHFRSPEEIFSEFFGEDPFADLFSDEFDPFFVGFGGHHFGGGGGGGRSLHGGRGRHNDTDLHENEFGMHLNLNFPGGQTYRTVVQPAAATRIRTSTVIHTPPEPAVAGSRRSRTRTKSSKSKTSSNISTAARGVPGNGTGTGSGVSRNSTVTCSSTTTRVVNGKRVTVQKTLENGVETTTVYEDDVLTSRTIKNM